jgi:glycosyltransferase involved in cell wall biosynthesis
VVANSRAGLEAWGVGPAKGRVVYNAFDPARWELCEGGDERPRDAAHPFTVVMTGRMVAHKDFATVIAAAAELDAAEPGRWRFLLLGDGPERPRLVALAGDLAARGVVALVDPGLEVLPLVREADAGVLMSNEAQHTEGCSNAIMEYMACGLPVVCSSGGGNPELVRDGETGHLVPGGDAAALVARLRELAVDPALARRLGHAGRERLAREFTVERLVTDLERVYREALS